LARVSNGSAGAAYALSGSEAITVSEAAEVIAGVTGKSVKHNDVDRDVWIQGSVAAACPPNTARCCGC
jgi:hypothetical protein